jgi:hypothetical protein
VNRELQENFAGLFEKNCKKGLTNHFYWVYNAGREGKGVF